MDPFPTGALAEMPADPAKVLVIKTVALKRTRQQPVDDGAISDRRPRASTMESSHGTVRVGSVSKFERAVAVSGEN